MATVFIPNVFVAGTPAVATEVNQNFTAITTQVNGNLDATNLADGAVTTNKIVDLAVTTGKIANLGVTEGKIAAAAVTNAKLASGIDAAKITTGTLPIARIANNAVTNAKLDFMPGTTIKGRISIDAGVPVDLSPGQVRSMLNVADGANNYTHPNHTGDVTSVGDGATTIANNAVTVGKIADGAVTNVKLASGIDAAKLTTGTLPIARIADGAVTGAKLGTSAVGDRGASLAGTASSQTIAASTNWVPPKGVYMIWCTQKANVTITANIDATGSGKEWFAIYAGDFSPIANFWIIPMLYSDGANIRINNNLTSGSITVRYYKLF